MTLMGELFHRFLLHSTLGRPARQYLFGTRGITGLHLNALLPSMGYAPEQYMADMQQVLRKRFGKGWHQLAGAIFPKWSRVMWPGAHLDCRSAYSRSCATDL